MASPEQRGRTTGQRSETRASFDDRRNLVKIREVAGIFRSNAVEDAVHDLMLAGIDRADIDLTGAIEPLERRSGGLFSSAADLANAPAERRHPFVSKADGAVLISVAAGTGAFAFGAAAAQRVFASGGEVWVAAGVAILGALIGGGVGAWVAYRWLRARFEWELDKQIAAMGVVVWVRVRSPEQEAAVIRILTEHGAEAVRVHEFEIDKSLEGTPLSALRPSSALPEEHVGVT
jgi:hypothetical protein